MILHQLLLYLYLPYALSFTEEANTKSQNDISSLRQELQVLDGSQSLSSFPKGRNLQDTCDVQTTHRFEIQVVLDLYGKPHQLSQDEKDLLGEAIMHVYNEQIFCSGNNFRQIQAVNIVPTTFPDLDTQDFSVSYIVTGSCRGCNSTTTLFEYSNRNDVDTCPCQGPTPLTFNVYFSNHFYQLVGERSLTSVSGLYRNLQILQNVLNILHLRVRMSSFNSMVVR
jgi:hypothetical protein